MTREEFAKLSNRDKFIKMFKQQAQKDPEGLKKQKEEMRSSVLVDTKIEGDKATLTIKEGDKEEKQTLVKEDGVWKAEMD